MDNNERKIHHDANITILGSEFARYLKLKAMCREQIEIIRALNYEIGVLKSELHESQHKLKKYETENNKRQDI